MAKVFGRHPSQRAVHKATFDAFVAAYVTALLWANGMDEALESHDYSKTYGLKDFTPAARKEILSDCRGFLRSEVDIAGYATLLAETLPTPARVAQAGVDFALTRNRHGAGFWDGDWPKNLGEQFTNIAHVYGSQSAIKPARGKLYVIAG